MTGPGEGPGATSLARFGYREQLQRTLRAFSSFALSFSLISMTTGIFGDFSQGIRQAGPAVIWSWMVALGGQMLVALVVAWLVRRYPISGYGYQWVSRIIGPRIGFFAGWLLLLQWVTGLPGICGVVGEYLRALDGGRYSVIPVPWITVLVISAAALLNIASIRLTALWNDAGVITEIAGSLGVALVLLFAFGIHHPHPVRFLFDTTNAYTHRPAGFGGFALSLLMGVWCLTGFEAAADLAEETERPEIVAPRAVIQSLAASGLGGFVVLLGFVLSIGNLPAAQASGAPLLDVLVTRLGPAAARFVLLVVFASVFACALATLALTSRLVFAMARDNVTPFAPLLARVNAKHGTPVAAIVVIWLFSCGVVLLLKRVALFTATSVVAGYLAYGLIALAGLRAATGFWMRAVSAAALIWCVFVIAAMTIPESSPGAGHTPAVAAAWGLAAGALVYFAAIRARLRRRDAEALAQPLLHSEYK